MDLTGKIEAILFWKAGPMKKATLAKILAVSIDSINQSFFELKEKLQGRGVSLVENDEEISLVTAKNHSDLIQELSKEEISRDIGKAGLETLSIVLYMGPISRRDIDYIRGVNSSFILRHLLVRGFVKKNIAKNDQRVFLYEPTIDLLNHLGLKEISELPNFSEIKTKLVEFSQKAEKEIKEETLEDDSGEIE